MTEIKIPLIYLRSENIADAVPQWDASYINVEQVLLFELILAANYMDIKPLLDLTCATVAFRFMIKDNTPEEFRQILNLLPPKKKCEVM